MAKKVHDLVFVSAGTPGFRSDIVSLWCVMMMMNTYGKERSSVMPVQGLLNMDVYLLLFRIALSSKTGVLDAFDMIDKEPS